MTNDEIKQMFLANAKLRHMPLVDPKRQALEEYLDKATKQYVVENLGSQDFTEASNTQTAEMPIQDAFNVLAMACQSATNLEHTYKPNNISDDDIRGLVKIRKMALLAIANAIGSTTPNNENV